MSGKLPDGGGGKVPTFGFVIDTAKSRACGLLLMASHGRRGVSAMLLGGETLKVLTYSAIPVLGYR